MSGGKKNRHRPHCDCGAALNNEGLCPFGCEQFAKPHARYRGEANRARQREREAAKLIGLKEVVAGVAVARAKGCG